MREKQLLTMRQVAEEFNFVSENAVRALAAKGDLPYKRLGRRVYCLRYEIEAYLSKLPGWSVEEAMQAQQK